MKRAFDLLCATTGLLLCLPLFAFIALAIRLDSPGPVFFRQQRVGRHGRLFAIHKFRSMHVRPQNAGHEITVNNDPRVTRSGRWLRQWKLDELPQLLDVLYGDMSLVGPRPEVPKYVAVYPDDVRDVVLSVRPGITDLASIRFRDENAMLDASSDPDTTYRELILPEKLKLQMEYVAGQSFATDMKILLQTACRVVRP